MKMPKKMGLIAVCGGKFEWSFDSINAHFDSLSRYLGWKDICLLYTSDAADD